MNNQFTFTPRTIEILKNFNGISEGQIFQKGNIIQTISPSGSVFARAKISEEIPFDFAIPKLGNFLAIISLYRGDILVREDKQELDGKTRKVVTLIGDGKFKNTFVPCDPMLIPNHESHFPNNGVPSLVDRIFSPPELKIVFDLPKSTLTNAVTSARVFGSDILRLTAEKGVLSLRTANSKIRNAANEFSTDICETDIVGEWDYSLSGIIALPEDYRVKITPKGLMLMESADVSYAHAKRRD